MTPSLPPDGQPELPLVLPPASARPSSPALSRRRRSDRETGRPRIDEGETPRSPQATGGGVQRAGSATCGSVVPGFDGAPDRPPSSGPVAADRGLSPEVIRERVYEVMRQEYSPAAPHAAGGKTALAPGASPVGLVPSRRGTAAQAEPGARFEDPIPARMLNEFVYCPRLFYYEFVEGVFVESADTIRGSALHARVDTGKGDLPAGARMEKGEGTMEKGPESSSPGFPPAAEETIHSRSVQMGSTRLGVIAKMDLVEVRAVVSRGGDAGDLLTALEVCPVDYKAGAPREGPDANELWPTDRMQLGLQALVLRDNGYACREGLIYYRATKQRVRLPITDELEAWIHEQLSQARRCATGRIPPPLEASPKCVRCSLAPVCLPDETRLLQPAPPGADPTADSGDAQSPVPLAARQPPTLNPEPGPIRRLIAARDDTRALYLTTQGLRVGRRDEVLVVKAEDRRAEEVRVRDVGHVALFGNIQITTQAIQALCSAEVPVTYFSMGGWFYGVTRGHGLKNVFLRIEQCRRARDDAFALELSRRLVHGKIRNHRTMLMRNHVEPPSAVVTQLKHLADKALTATSREELLGFEGSAAAAYFAEFSGMLKVADELAGEGDPWDGQLRFNFEHRNRRPPTDPVNALLSLGYSLLAKDCTVAALAVGFDPYIGFYHQPRFGRPALALDLMEEFRPLIAESAVLASINNRILTVKDFVRAGDAVNLTAAGRKRFFQTYEQRINALLTHPLFDYKVSYRRALELQTRILAKMLTGEIPDYAPLMTR